MRGMKILYMDYVQAKENSLTWHQFWHQYSGLKSRFLHCTVLCFMISAHRLFFCQTCTLTGVSQSHSLFHSLYFFFLLSFSSVSHSLFFISLAHTHTQLPFPCCSVTFKCPLVPILCLGTLPVTCACVNSLKPVVHALRNEGALSELSTSCPTVPS